MIQVRFQEKCVGYHNNGKKMHEKTILDGMENGLFKKWHKKRTIRNVRVITMKEFWKTNGDGGIKQVNCMQKATIKMEQLMAHGYIGKKVAKKTAKVKL